MKSLFILLTYLFASTHLLADSQILATMPFSDKEAMKEWKEKIWKGKVKYWVDIERDNGFMHARSDRACSIVYRNIRFNLREYPTLSWKWSVLRFPQKEAKFCDPIKDDIPARVFLVFPGATFKQWRFLEYAWDENIPEGTIIPSKYPNIKQLVVQSGRKAAGEWVSERQNAYEDYKMAFGAEPPSSTLAVALLCNANNYDSTAEALFDDIEISK